MATPRKRDPRVDDDPTPQRTGRPRRFRNVGSTFVYIHNGIAVPPGASIELTERPVDAPPWLVEER